MLLAQKTDRNAVVRERRKARRYEVSFKAKAGLKADQPTPCTVRNVSALGALLEFDSPVKIPRYFRIAIEAPRFSADCEVRHRTGNSVGVMFTSNRADALDLFS